MGKSPLAEVKQLPFNTCMLIKSYSAPDETRVGLSKFKRTESPFEVHS
jgi:hypothetical protein